MNITKKTLIFYFIILICFLLSAMGVYILAPVIGKFYFSISLFIFPLIAANTIYSQIQTKEKP